MVGTTKIEKRKSIYERKRSSLFLEAERSIPELLKYAGWIMNKIWFTKEMFFRHLQKGHIWNIQALTITCKDGCRGGFQELQSAAVPRGMPSSCNELGFLSVKVRVPPSPHVPRKETKWEAIVRQANCHTQAFGLSTLPVGRKAIWPNLSCSPINPEGRHRWKLNNPITEQKSCVNPNLCFPLSFSWGFPLFLLCRSPG